MISTIHTIIKGLAAGPKLIAGLWAGPDAVQAASSKQVPGCLVLIITYFTHLINLLQKTKKKQFDWITSGRGGEEGVASAGNTDGNSTSMAKNFTMLNTCGLSNSQDFMTK
jgi:hypothetical protein